MKYPHCGSDPFDTVKVRLQTQPTVNPIYCEPSSQPVLAVCFALSKSAKRLTGILLVNAAGFIDCTRKTLQWEGVAGLYKV